MYRLMLDTANLGEIEKAVKALPVDGVTTNPSILCREGKIDVYSHLSAIKKLCGEGKCLHVQVISTDTDTMIKEARCILDRLGEQDVYVKIPATSAGIAAMKALSDQGVKVTATATFSAMQGMLAALAGAKYIAVFFNRLQAQGGDPAAVISTLRDFIDSMGLDTKILAASFKNPAQVVEAFRAGAHCATVAPSVLTDGLSLAIANQAVSNFTRDAAALCGEGKTMLDI